MLNPINNANIDSILTNTTFATIQDRGLELSKILDKWLEDCSHDEDLQKAREQIETCWQEKTIMLDLENLGISGLPEAIWPYLTHIKELSLAQNDFTAIPEGLNQLSQLQWLDLADNEIEQLPSWFWQLNNLEQLKLDQNKLSSFPREISELTNLRALSLAKNNLTSLPQSFTQLTNLVYLILFGNQFVEVPEQIVTLVSTHGLVRLDFCHNQCACFPEALTTTCNIQTFQLTGNPIQNWPDDIGDYTRDLSKTGHVYHLLRSELSFVDNKGRSIDFTFDLSSGTVHAYHHRQKIGQFDFTDWGDEDNYLLTHVEINKRYKHSGIGTKMVQIIVDHIESTLYVRPNTGRKYSDGAHQTGNDVGPFYTSLVKQGLVKYTQN